MIKKTFSKTDGVIILGGGITPQGYLSHESLERIATGIKIIQTNRAQYLILSGNGYWQKKISPSRTEANLMANIAVKNGISKKVIWIENKSLDTIGNAYFTKSLIEENNLGKSFIIITSDYHIKRTKWLFNKLFGSKYKLIFKGVNSGLSLKKHRMKTLRDYKILKYTQQLFIDNKIKSDKSIKMFLISNHPFYTSSKKRKKILAKQKELYGIDFINI